jgi:hypothetical protein
MHRNQLCTQPDDNVCTRSSLACAFFLSTSSSPASSTSVCLSRALSRAACQESISTVSNQKLALVNTHTHAALFLHLNPVGCYRRPQFAVALHGTHVFLLFRSSWLCVSMMRELAQPKGHSALSISHSPPPPPQHYPPIICVPKAIRSYCDPRKH